MDLDNSHQTGLAERLRPLLTLGTLKHRAQNHFNLKNILRSYWFVHSMLIYLYLKETTSKIRPMNVTRHFTCIISFNP